MLPLPAYEYQILPYYTNTLTLVPGQQSGLDFPIDGSFRCGKSPDLQF
jgi:hypothetical protein